MLCGNCSNFVIVDMITDEKPLSIIIRHVYYLSKTNDFLPKRILHIQNKYIFIETPLETAKPSTKITLFTYRQVYLYIDLNRFLFPQRNSYIMSALFRLHQLWL